MKNMNDKGLFDFKTVIVLITIIVLSSLAFLVVLRIDSFVHEDLYSYGLQFDLLWANDYWFNKNLLLTFITGATVLSALSMLPHFDHSNKPTTFSKWAGNFVPIVAAIYMVLSISFFLRIDDIIKNTLPQYGVSLSYLWTAEYWNLNTSLVTLMITSLLLLIIPTIRTLEILEIELED